MVRVECAEVMRSRQMADVVRPAPLPARRVHRSGSNGQSRCVRQAPALAPALHAVPSLRALALGKS